MVLKTPKVHKCRNMQKCGSKCVEQVHTHHHHDELWECSTRFLCHQIHAHGKQVAMIIPGPKDIKIHNWIAWMYSICWLYEGTLCQLLTSRLGGQSTQGYPDFNPCQFQYDLLELGPASPQAHLLAQAHHPFLARQCSATILRLILMTIPKPT